MAFLPYRDAMMGRSWTTTGMQINPVSSMTTTNIPLAGPYRSGMMDYRESEGHRDWLKQQDTAFNSPTGLNSHRESGSGLLGSQKQESSDWLAKYRTPIRSSLEVFQEISREVEQRKAEEHKLFIKNYFENQGPKLIDPASIVRQSRKETVFSGYGNSHLSYLDANDDLGNPVRGFHVTTQIPGIGKKEGLDHGLSVHDRI